MKHKKIIFIFTLISLALLASGCEEKLSAEEIVTKMQEKEAGLEDYSGTIHTTIYLNGEKDLEEEIQIMHKKPNLIKTFAVEEGKEVKSVSDGEFVWSYDAETNTVTKIKLPEEPLLTDKDFISLIGDFINGSEVSMLGVEEVDGRSAYILEARPKIENSDPGLDSRTKVWVDKETWMVLKSSVYNNKGNLTMDVEIRNLKVNTGVPDSEFKFEIPDGAEVVTVDLDEKLSKFSENLSLEEARELASFEIFTPEYVPEGYVLNSVTISKDDNIASENQNSETAVLSYQKRTESFDITETVYETEPEENKFMQEGEKISINGREGVYLNEFGDLKMLQWRPGGVEIALIGSLEKAEMLKIAESIQEPFTEFYILGPEGTAENYPTEYVLGESGTLIVGIINHEQKSANYTMEVRLKDTSLPLPAEWENIVLENNETLERAINITPPFEGTDMGLEFLLYNEDKKNMLEENISVSYRDLHLLINVGQNLSENGSTPLTAK